MKSPFFDIFSQQVSGNRFLRIFEDMASTITHEYIVEVNEFINKCGYPPSFGEVFERLKSLNGDLHAKAMLILNDYRAEKGHRSANLTKGCKRVIKISINSYLKQLRLIFGSDKFENLLLSDINFPGFQF